MVDGKKRAQQFEMISWLAYPRDGTLMNIARERITVGSRQRSSVAVEREPAVFCNCTSRQYRIGRLVPYRNKKKPEANAFRLMKKTSRPLRDPA